MIDVIAIAARAENNAIGFQGKLPWHLPQDLQFFKAQTVGRPVILGRKTWESFGSKPLQGRPHFVITAQKEYKAQGATVCHTVQNALDLALKEAQRLGQEAVMVIGGAEVYKQAYPYFTKMILTRVYGFPQGDTFFPIFDEQKWSCSVLETYSTHCYEIYVPRIERAFSSTKETI